MITIHICPSPIHTELLNAQTTLMAKLEHNICNTYFVRLRYPWPSSSSALLINSAIGMNTIIAFWEDLTFSPIQCNNPNKKWNVEAIDSGVRGWSFMNQRYKPWWSLEPLSACFETHGDDESLSFTVKNVVVVSLLYCAGMHANCPLSLIVIGYLVFPY